jgi:hypothetical protein
MNYLAHAIPFLDNPYFVAGTSVPDWMMVADRGVRMRAKNVEPWTRSPDAAAAAVAAGVLQHLRDDGRFHATRAFAETNLQLGAAVREVLGDNLGLVPNLLAHLLVELLLDATLAAEAPERLEAYYSALGQVDFLQLERVVCQIGTQPTVRLAPFARLFLQARILSDYAEDAKLMVRVNQVLRRLGREPVDESLAAIFPRARQIVADRRPELLEGIPVKEKTPCVTV